MTDQKVHLGCELCGAALGLVQGSYCLDCRASGKVAAAKRAARQVPHSEVDPIVGSRTRLDPPCGRPDSPLRLPTIHRLLAEDYSDCFVVHCVCGFESPPFIDEDAARAVAWEHIFPDGRVSDLRYLQSELEVEEEMVSANR